ncbi:hypothetical protein ABMB60_004408 [Salmonella enterica]|nr:hypothetical protein [Salmonella enterica subsp. enterica serovar Kottbus]EBZ4144306.1 hypothetical protein [Salmonella enterica subsp. enterica serovar Kottbus]EEJ5142927.1 hypothetical protein [Salmonella enterica subsp. enterica serovar Hadar]
MESNEDESIEELQRKVKYYNQKLYRVVIIGCLSQSIGFCLYSYFNNYALVFMAIPLFIIAMISCGRFFFLSNEALPIKIKLINLADKFNYISKKDYRLMMIRNWEYIALFGTVGLYNANAIFHIIFK